MQRNVELVISNASSATRSDAKEDLHNKADQFDMLDHMDANNGYNLEDSGPIKFEQNGPDEKESFMN